MFELIGSLFSFAFGVVKLGLSLAWGAIQFVVGLLSGIFSFILSLGGILLAGSLVLLAIFRRSAYKKHREQRNAAESAGAEKVYDVDEEEFTSFYDQFRQQE